MSPLDKESIESKVARIRKNLRELKKFSQLPYKDYVKDFHNTATAERFLQVSIEAMLDIGSHIIAEEGLGEPIEYRNVFAILLQAKILPPSMEKSLMDMVGLRNRIVHLYEDIDHKMIHRFLKKELPDFNLFIETITRYLKK